jgi:hypothetical protein
MTFTTHEFDEIPDPNTHPLTKKTRKPKSPSEVSWYAICSDGHIIENKSLKDLKQSLLILNKTVKRVIKGKSFIPKITTTFDIVKGDYENKVTD